MTFKEILGFILILLGSITVPSAFRQQTWAPAAVDVVHRGESGNEPTVLLTTYAGTPGVPTSTPAKGQKAEY